MAADSKLVLRDGATAGNLTATGNGTGVDVSTGGLPLTGIAVRVIVPQAAGTSPTLDVKIQESADNSTWRDLVSFPQITAAGKYVRRFSGRLRYLRYAATVCGTSPNFVAVQIDITNAEGNES